MSDDFSKDNIQFHPAVLEELDRLAKEDPQAAQDARELFAAMRQAHTSWQAGQYDSFEDALEAITGTRPIPVDLDDEEAKKDVARLTELRVNLIDKK